MMRSSVWVAAVLGLLLTLPVLVLAAPLLLVAAVTRALGDRGRQRIEAAGWRSFVEYEPVIGWRPRPNLDTYGVADDVFHLTTGPDGWRGHVPIEQADVLVLGDSFAFGHGASDDAMYSAYARGLRVKPMGCDGYDMVHGALWLERLAPALSGKLVVWFVFYGNDLWENLLPTMGHYRKPFIRQVGDEPWTIVTDHVTPEPWPFPSPPRSYHERLAEICTPGTQLHDRAFEACDDLIRRAADTCRRADARLAVIGVPDRVQLTRRGQAKLARLSPSNDPIRVLLPDRRLAASCRRHDVDFVPLSEHLDGTDYLVQDIHWRRTGHRKVGALLADVHERTAAVLVEP